MLVSEVLSRYLPPIPTMYFASPTKEARARGAEMAVKCNCNPSLTIGNCKSETVGRILWEQHNETTHGAKDVGAVTATV